MAKQYTLDQHFKVCAVSKNHFTQNLRGPLQRLASLFVHELPIFTDTPAAMPLDSDDEAGGGVERHEVPGVQGAFVLTNVLTPDECERLAAQSEAMGYSSPPLTLGLRKKMRSNANVEWTVSDTLLAPIFARCRDYLPQRVGSGHLCGVNARWRLYRYNQREVFRPHIDAPWPGSGVDADGKFCFDMYGDRKSQLTFLLYLNDDFQGGHTSFFEQALGDKPGPGDKICAVKVPQGGALCFFHGDHPLSLWHEGSTVTAGTKYVVRSEVLYTLPEHLCYR